MEIKDLSAILVVAMVGCVLVAGFIPVVGESVSATTTFENEGYFYMQKITADDSTPHVLYYETDGTNTNLTYELDGVEIPKTNWPTSPLSVTLATDGESWVMRASANSEYVGLQGVGSTLNFGGHDTRTTTVTFESGTVTMERTIYNPDTGQTSAGSTLTGTYTDLWIYSPTPTAYVMKMADKSAYMLADSTYLAMGITLVSQWNTAIKITGDVNEFDASIVYPPNVTTTVTNDEIHKTTVNGYNGLYSLDKLTFTISDGTTTVDATYSYFIVPAKVVAEKAIHADDNTASIVSMIPFILIMGIVLMFVGVVLVRRYV